MIRKINTARGNLAHIQRPKPLFGGFGSGVFTGMLTILGFIEKPPKLFEG
jgi:hypothetical protein